MPFGAPSTPSFPDGVISETVKAGFASRVAGVIEVERQFENMPAGRIEPSRRLFAVLDRDTLLSVGVPTPSW